MNEQELRAAVEYLDACLVDINERAGDASLADTEQRSFDEGLQMRNGYKAQLAKIAERKATVAGIAAAPVATEAGEERKAPGYIRSDDPFEANELRRVGGNMFAGKELRDKALKALERSEFVEDEHRDRVEHLLRRRDTREGALARHILATGSEAYRDAWGKLMSGRAHELSNEERGAVALERAMSLTAGNGGNAVPFTLDPTIILTNSGTINPLRQISRIRTTITNNWHGVTSAGVTASYDAEASEVSDDAPSVSQPSIPVAMARAFVPASIEIVEDFGGNLGSDVLELFADARDRLEANKFTLGAGSGSNEPKGVITAVSAVSGSRVASAVDDTFALGDVYSVHKALPARHRRNASWGAQLGTYDAIRQFGTANNYHGFWVDLGGDTPSQLLGKPAYEIEDMDGVIDATTNNDILIYGDFDKFQIVDRVGMSVEYIPHLFSTANGRPTGQRGWFAYWRNGSDVLDANAFRLLRV